MSEPELNEFLEFLEFALNSVNSLIRLIQVQTIALGIGADTGQEPNALCAYEHRARAAGNAKIKSKGKIQKSKAMYGGFGNC
ncbi:hypothetical protein PQ469_09495 [Mucilaginibacter sp. KACC 22773]|uniref:hypothetical protein n=1 Tax=Mucilaginibacter sp. KACC 22773 TaxID=3025671 RepID=UPI00236708F7|nr:hypothetical protein [Mucilaginibacter sp. KACC 22773]WDF80240.1 hypothetical protein PQ469_09495 [Mucilaginibacter sp. KACC 22773]